jgi:hypothetical protein
MHRQVKSAETINFFMQGLVWRLAAGEAGAAGTP